MGVDKTVCSITFPLNNIYVLVTQHVLVTNGMKFIVLAVIVVSRNKQLPRGFESRFILVSVRRLGKQIM